MNIGVDVNAEARKDEGHRRAGVTRRVVYARVSAADVPGFARDVLLWWMSSPRVDR